MKTYGLGFKGDCGAGFGVQSCSLEPFTEDGRGHYF